MRVPDDVVDEILAAALAVAVERGWRRLTLADVAAQAELPLLDLYRAVPTKARLARLLVVAIDRAVLEGGPADPADSPRDRLFDLMMRRFDALQGRRAGMIAVIEGLRADLFSAVALTPRLGASLGWMLEAAGIPSGGLVGGLRVDALALVYANALRIWIDDDTADMARTMAALDRGLGRLEQAARLLPSRWRADPGEAPAPAGDLPPSASVATPR